MRQIKSSQQSRHRQEQSSQSAQSSEQKEQQEQMLNAEMERIQQQLKGMPYQLILKQKQQPQQKKHLKGNNKEPMTPKIKRITKRKHIQVEKHEKNETVEISIHQRNRKKYAEIFQPKRKKTIDPRFQSFAGHYNPDLAMKSYNFIPKLQQAEISELKGKLKGKSKRHKLNPHQREVLTNEYNRVTSDFKMGELIQLEKQTKRELKQNHGQEFHIKKTVFKHEFQKKKLENMTEADRDKKLKERDTQMRRSQLNERRKTLQMNPQKKHFH